MNTAYEATGTSNNKLQLVTYTNRYSLYTIIKSVTKHTACTAIVTVSTFSPTFNLICA